MTDTPGTYLAIRSATGISSATLLRLSGVAVVVGMAIAGMSSVLYSRADGVALYLDPLVPIVDLAKQFGSLIFLIGLPALYGYQASRAGVVGLVGFVFSFVGLAMLEVGTEALFAFVGPALAAHPETHFLLTEGLDASLGAGFSAYLLASYLLVVAGFVSFGLASFRARVYPRWTGPVIAVGSVAAIVMAPLMVMPSGPFRLDRIGMLAAALAFVRCGWHLVRATSLTPSDRPYPSRSIRSSLAPAGRQRPERPSALPRTTEPVVSLE